MTRIAIIGTGNMGGAFADRLAGRKHSVIVFNRTIDKALALARRGDIRVARSVVEALNESELVILGLFDAAAIRAVMLSGDVISTLRGRPIMNIAHTTPEEICSLGQEFAAHGARLSEVNVVSYPENVRAGEAEFILAGPSQDREVWVRIFQDLGKQVHHVGALGNASRAEMALWLPYAFQTVAVAYAMGAFTKENLPPDVLKSVLTTNPILRIAASESAVADMTRRQYGTQQWSVDNMVASVDMAVEYAAALGLPTEVFRAIRDLYSATQRRGLGRNDVAAVYEAIVA